MKLSCSYLCKLLLLLPLLCLSSCQQREVEEQTFTEVSASLSQLNDWVQQHSRTLGYGIKKKCEAAYDDKYSIIFVDGVDSVANIKGRLFKFIERIKQELEAAEEVKAVLFDKRELGIALALKFNKTNSEMMAVVDSIDWMSEDERELLEQSLSLQVSSVSNENEAAKQWATECFYGLSKPVALAKLHALQSDVVLAQGKMLDYLDQQVQLNRLQIIEYHPVSVPNNHVIALGDTFETRIILARHHGMGPTTVLVDGETIHSKYGVGFFKTSPFKRGMHSHQINMEITNPESGEVEEHQEEIRYYVY